MVGVDSGSVSAIVHRDCSVRRRRTSPAHSELVCCGLDSHFTTRARDATSAAARRVDPRSPLQGSSSTSRGTPQPHLGRSSNSRWKQLKHCQCHSCPGNIAHTRHQTAETHTPPQPDYTIRESPTMSKQSQQPPDDMTQRAPSDHLGPDYKPTDQKPTATVSTKVAHENVTILPQTPQLIALLT